MKTLRLAIIACALAYGAPAVASPSTDEALRALTDSYFEYRVEQSGRVLNEDGSTEDGAKLPSVTAQSQTVQAERAEAFLRELDGLDGEAMGDAAKIDAAVFRTLLNAEIGDARFREWEMPFDSDNNFWSYLAGRSGFRTVEEYERYIAR